MRVSIRAGVLAAVATVALAVAGCTSPTSTPADEAPAPEAETGPVAEPEEEPTPQVVEASAGDIVTEEEAELLPEGQTGYPLEDGTLVVVDVDEELPQVLVEELDSRYPDEPQSEIERPAGRYSGSNGEVLRLADDIYMQTGREMIFVFRGGRYDGGQLQEVIWTTIATGEAWEIMTRNASSLNNASGTRESALAFAEWALGEVEDPDSYQILVQGEV